MAGPRQLPAAKVEWRLVDAILSGTYPPGGTLPAERELAHGLGVARPTLREALHRLASQGWITIRQGRPTVVNDYWTTGNPRLLGALAEHPERLPGPFVGWLLEARLALAPAYARAAVREAAAQVVALLAGAESLTPDPHSYACFDWELHRALARLGGNPVYTLILNGFEELYARLAPRYFERAEGRAFSRRFYARLLDAAMDRNPAAAERVTCRAMAVSIRLWKRLDRERAVGTPATPGSEAPTGR
ncbi:GntR family transcriptional regulator [Limnochorda pilosa]|uniref:GntR family transcriptional regulator n=1 Tax=Limnochorda pilosa TaxID=1555112 RepID=A0A0K2SHA8_LIMPI|nr:GntR family transcriptional regulator [Limnochorda pilosa]BAS26422.1 GntR family transcriptional regulator [Limnochorda pilosa]